MKQKTILLSAMFLLAFISSRAQGFYLGVTGGYGLGALRSVYETSEVVASPNYSQTIHAKSYSLGQGINAGLFAGYMFNTTLGAELDASYLFGNKFSFKDTYTFNNGINASNQNDYTLQATMIRLAPCLRVQFGNGKLSGYTKTGIIIGLAPKVLGTENYVTSFSGLQTTTYSEWEYTGGLSLGFHGALGARYTFGKLGVFCELAAYLQNWAMKKGTLTVDKVNGVDQLSSMPDSEKEITFKDSYTYSSGSLNDPTQATKVYLPLSSIGLNAGVQFAF